MPKRPRVVSEAIKRVERKESSPEEKQRNRERAAHARKVYQTKVRQAGFVTDLQERFVICYSKCFDKRLAYIRAGGSPNGAAQAAVNLLKKDSIKKLIDEIDAERAERLKVTPERIIAELAKMAHVNMDDFTVIQADGSIITDFSGVDRDQMAGVQEVIVETYMEGKGDDAREVKKVRFKLADKKGALELLGKTQRLFVDRQELTGPDGKPLTPPSLIVKFVDPPPRKDDTPTSTKGDGKP